MLSIVTKTASLTDIFTSYSELSSFASTSPIAEVDFQGFKKSIEGRKDKEVFEVIKCALCE
jgi:hypothetical protein